jgi:hypothetical protein
MTKQQQIKDRHLALIQQGFRNDETGLQVAAANHTTILAEEMGGFLIWVAKSGMTYNKKMDCWVNKTIVRTTPELVTLYLNQNI